MENISDEGRKIRAEYLREWRKRMTEEQKERRKEYHRKYYQSHKGQYKEYRDRYWNNKANKGGK